MHFESLFNGAHNQVACARSVFDGNLCHVQTDSFSETGFRLYAPSQNTDEQKHVHKSDCLSDHGMSNLSVRFGTNKRHGCVSAPLVDKKVQDRQRREIWERSAASTMLRQRSDQDLLVTTVSHVEARLCFRERQRTATEAEWSNVRLFRWHRAKCPTSKSAVALEQEPVCPERVGSPLTEKQRKETALRLESL